MLAATVFASGTAFAQANAGGQVSDTTFPPGFDCSSLDSAKTRLACQTTEANQAPDVAPGTPAFAMPGQSNSTSGPYLGQNPGAQDLLPGRHPGNGH